MSTTKKESAELVSLYKEAAAARRVKFAAVPTSHADEVQPTEGRIRVALSGKQIAGDRRRQLFGPDRIEIPELSTGRKKNAS